MQNVRLVAVGDDGVGKTCMLITHSTNAFPGECVPTVFDNFECNYMIDGKPALLSLCDTAGHADYDRLRPIFYPSTDIFLVCYSVISKVSFENIKTKWIPEITYACGQDTLFIVLGTKTDLRNDEQINKMVEKVYTKQDGIALANEVKAHCYLECSALVQDGLKEVFDTAMSAALTKRNKEDKERRRQPCECTLL